MKCTCEFNMLMTVGCKCGAFKAEQALKNNPHKTVEANEDTPYTVGDLDEFIYLIYLMGEGYGEWQVSVELNRPAEWVTEKYKLALEYETMEAIYEDYGVHFPADPADRANDINRRIAHCKKYFKGGVVHDNQTSSN